SCVCLLPREQGCLSHTTGHRLAAAQPSAARSAAPPRGKWGPAAQQSSCQQTNRGWRFLACGELGASPGCGSAPEYRLWRRPAEQVALPHLDAEAAQLVDLIFELDHLRDGLDFQVAAEIAEVPQQQAVAVRAQ